MLENERKWLLSRKDCNKIMSGKKCISASSIEQVYLNKQTRIRRRDYGIKLQFSKTTKTGSGMSRQESTRMLTEEQYNKEKEKGEYLIRKTRLEFKYDGDLVMELDLFEDLDLILLEIEFDTVTQAESFVGDFSYQKEVTYDKSYKNYYLAKEG